MIDEIEEMPEQVEPQQPLVEPGVALEQVKRLTRKAFDARKDTIGEKWRVHRMLYNLDFNWAGKRKDQSKHPLADLSQAVDWKAQALVDALISNSKDPFDLAPETDMAELIAPIYQACLSFNLDQEDFPTLLQDSLVSGQLTCGCAFHVYPDPTKDPTSGYARIEPEVMERVFRDPTGRGKYKLRVAPYDKQDVLRMAQEQGWDMAEAARCGDHSSPETEQWREEAGDLVSYQTIEQDGYRNTVYLTEYWGPVWSGEGGELVIPFARVVVADNQYELLVQPDPYGDGQGDLVDGDFKPRSTFPYGKSEVEDCVPMVELGTRVFNSIADNVAASTAHFVEINESLFTQDTVKVLKGSVKSGQSLPKSSAGDLATPKALAQPNPMALEFYMLCNSAFQKYSSAPDMARGFVDVENQGKETATGVRTRQGNASQTLKGLARAVETRVIRPLLERMLYYLVTYGDINSEWVQRIASKEIEAARQKVMKQLLEESPPDIPQQPQAPIAEGVDPETQEPMAIPDEGNPVYQLGMQVWEQQVQQVMQAWEVEAGKIADEKIMKAWREPCSVRVRGISGVLEREGRNETLQSVVGMIGGMSPDIIDIPKVALALCRNAGILASDVLVADSEDELRMQQEQAQQRQMMQAQAEAEANGPAQKPQGPPAKGKPADKKA